MAVVIAAITAAVRAVAVAATPLLLSWRRFLRSRSKRKGKTDRPIAREIPAARL